MVKEERLINLTRYMPGFLRETKELRQAAGSEEAEVSRLYGKIDQIWNNGFVRTADSQGIKRWEALLGINPYPGDSLDERRAAVLSRWNQQLPYSLTRLRERLDAAVGTSNYELNIRHELYELELVLIAQAYRVMQEMRDMTKEMIPANLLFIFAGRYPVEIPVNIRPDARLEMLSEYYVRYNRVFLLLDGTWALDGTYKLNGYKELTDIDLYPAFLAVSSCIRAEYGIDNTMRISCEALLEQTEESGLKCKSAAGIPLDNCTSLRIAGMVMAAPEAASILAIHGIAENLALSSISTTVESSAGVEPGSVSELVQIKSEEPVSYGLDSTNRITGLVEVNTDTSGGVHVASSCAASAFGIARVRASSSSKAGVAYEHQLRMERNLWHLDGTHLLDGSMKLNAEVFNYEL